ncbi:MAG: hypothetical protein Q9219_006597 [cf. Caloplaca sp. 3 TL-2023]
MSVEGIYSSLEVLLLLQGIQVYGAKSPTFDTLSKNLKSSNITTRDVGEDNEHFAPNALRSLYLRLLKEEVKLKNQKDLNSRPVQDGHNESPTREIASPPMETVEEAALFSNLIPQLANRVYDNHRDSTIKLIEDEERRYHQIQNDVQEIERGDWDARLHNEETSSARDSKGLASIQTLLQDESSTEKSPANAPGGASPTLLPSIQQKQPTQGVPLRETPPHSITHANNDLSAPNADTTGIVQQASPPRAVVSPTRARQPVLPSHSLPSTTPKPSSQSSSAENAIPFLPPPQHIQHGFHQTPPPAELHRRQPSQPANIAPSPGNLPPQPPLPPPERSSGSPIILPPPPGMLRTTSSPSRPLDALADMAGQQYRSHAMPSPRPPKTPNSAQHPVQLPPPSSYPHRPYQYPQHDSRMLYQNPYAPYPPAPLPGYSAPQYAHVSPHQYPAHTPGKLPHYAPMPQYQAPAISYPQYPSYSNTPMYTPQGPPAPTHPHYQTPRPFDQWATYPVSETKRKSPRPSPINTSVSSTKWKYVDLQERPGSPKSPVPPGLDEISPISAKAPSPVLEPKAIRIKGLSQQNTKSSAKDSTPAPAARAPAVRGRRGRPPRGTATRGRGGRRASTASSARGTRTRSASAGSGADELALEPPTSTTHQAAVKPEPPATPARDSSASIPPIATVDTDSNRKSTRRRRETLRGIESTAETTRTGTKRKRTIETSDPEANKSIVRSGFDRQKDELSRTYVLASRNLPRTSATLMNDISAHKFASIFAKPLTEREAPGYHSLIYRPQDLKSIKQAITNGNRALTSFLEQAREENDGARNNNNNNSGGRGDVVPVAGASESDPRVWVRKTEDVVPPKGIVNSTQLEREIMRVFANAVMFNPDPGRGFGPAFRTRARRKERHVPAHLKEEEEEESESEEEEGRVEEEEEGGVVKDAREMCEDVERVVGEWRAAEEAAAAASSATAASVVVRVGKGKSGAEEEEEDELAGEESGVVGEEDAGEERVGKRRRRRFRAGDAV